MMTEQEWLDGTDPQTMWEFLRGKASERKLRLFGCACCRRIWHILTDYRSRRAVEVGERFVDGLANDAERKDAAVEANEAISSVEKARPLDQQDKPAWDAYHMSFDATAAAHGMVYRDNDDETIFGTDLGYQPAVAAAYYCKNNNSAVTKSSPTRDADMWVSCYDIERAAQCHLLRDLFANPFRPVSLALAWLTPAVLNLAQAAYENRILPSGLLDNTGLAVLADALEEAGCDNADILNHLRQPGEHVRGCWAVDLLLGKG